MKKRELNPAIENVFANFEEQMGRPISKILRDWVSEGYSGPWIAQRIGVSAYQVRVMCARHGIVQTRPRRNAKHTGKPNVAEVLERRGLTARKDYDGVVYRLNKGMELHEAIEDYISAVANRNKVKALYEKYNVPYTRVNQNAVNNRKRHYGIGFEAAVHLLSIDRLAEEVRSGL